MDQDDVVVGIRLRSCPCGRYALYRRHQHCCRRCRDGEGETGHTRDCEDRQTVVELLLAENQEPLLVIRGAVLSSVAEDEAWAFVG